MARVNVYFPDDLIEQARRAELNVSELAQAAVRRELAARGMSSWLHLVASLPPVPVTHAQAVRALDAARDELGW